VDKVETNEVWMLPKFRFITRIARPCRDSVGGAFRIRNSTMLFCMDVKVTGDCKKEGRLTYRPLVRLLAFEDGLFEVWDNEFFGLFCTAE
jgi:hypothetical protein